MQRIYLANPLKRRIPYAENRVDGILMYGKDNLYPQRMIELMKRSGAATRSVSLLSKFVVGAGFVDAALNSEDLIINHAGQTPLDLLQDVANTWGPFRGAAIHTDFNGFLQPINPKVIDFEYCRLGVPDEKGHVSKIVISDDWAYEKGKPMKSRIQRVDTFNPEADVVLAQIIRAGGLANYNGQLLYLTPQTDKYATATFDEVISDVETDAGVSKFRETSVTTNFMAGHFVELPYEFETEKEREDFNIMLAKFQGVDNNGRILVIENKFADKVNIKLQKVDVQDNDKLFEWTDQSASTKIRMHYTQPAILVGDLVPGRLGNTLEVENSFNFYNLITHMERTRAARALKRVLKGNPAMANITNFSIQPLTWSMYLQSIGSGTAAAQGAPGQASAGPQRSALGDLGVREINRVMKIKEKVKAGTMSAAEATPFLEGLGFSTEQATKFIGDIQDGNDEVTDI